MSMSFQRFVFDSWIDLVEVAELTLLCFAPVLLPYNPTNQTQTNVEYDHLSLRNSNSCVFFLIFL